MNIASIKIHSNIYLKKFTNMLVYEVEDWYRKNEYVIYFQQS